VADVGSRQSLACPTVKNGPKSPTERRVGGVLTGTMITMATVPIPRPRGRADHDMERL